MPKNGYVKWFDEKRGYGFITMNDDDEESLDVFVHFSNILMEGFRKLDIGDIVEFELKESDDKGPEAINVRIMVKDHRFS